MATVKSLRAGSPVKGLFLAACTMLFPICPGAQAAPSLADKDQALAECMKNYLKTIPLTRDENTTPSSLAQRFLSTNEPDGRDPVVQASYIIACMAKKGYTADTKKCGSFSYVAVRSDCFDPMTP